MIPTSQLANALGVRPQLLRQWVCRGHLKLAPHGKPGQGRGIENLWSPAAAAEARRMVEQRGLGR